MSFKYQPEGNHALALQAWVLDDAPKYEIQEMRCPLVCRDEMFGVLAGPSVPTGELSRVMAVAVLSGGGSYSLAKVCSMYSAGVDGHTKASDSRFDTELYLCKDGDNDHRPYQNSYHVHGAFCPDEDVYGFDFEFFDYSSEQASIMSPNQRLILQVGYEALFNAGFSKKTLLGQNIFVYLGDCNNEWWSINQTREWNGEKAEKQDLDWYGVQTHCITSARLSWNLGLTGPNWMCDTACSSGLSAFCTANYSMKRATRGLDCFSVDLRSKACLSGGVNMVVDAGVYLANSAQHMLSLKGRCFTFDVGGDGYARGEGVSLAYNILSESDKDAESQIGIAIGNKVNQDGRSASMTAPNGPSQQLCIKASLKEAGVEPHDITASECHGTGTSLGDPIEVGSLRGVQESDDRENGLFCTSSKSNIGHLEASAGSTGLFKCLLQNMYGFCTPNCHMRSLNPHLDAAGWPAFFQSEMVDFSANTGLVGVSSFGISGTNAHAETWGQVRCGPRKALIKQGPELLDQVTLTCPITMGPIDHLTGEPASRFFNQRAGERKKYKANILRDGFAPYDISSTVYEGGYRFRMDELDPDADEPIDPGVTIHICGSWSGWHQLEEMERLDDGSYVSTMILGESRCELFYICIAGEKSLRIYPTLDRANSRIHVMGPNNAENNTKCWMVDGRDEEIPAGTCYQIHFTWTKEKKFCFWEEVGPKHASKAIRFDHRYSIRGSWTADLCDSMLKDPNEDGVFEYIVRLGYTGEERFQLCRDDDLHQIIYPAKKDCEKTSILVRGPDDLSKGKYWLVKGAVGDQITIKLEVDDGKVVVAVISETKGEKVYESQEGVARHEYCLGGSWNHWEFEPMTPDPDIPGVYKGTGTIGETYADDYNAYVEFFNVAVDGDPNFVFYPEVSYTGSGEQIVFGPGGAEDSPWMVKGFAAGATFEVVLDLNAIDRRKIVTWKLQGTKSLPYGINLFEDGRIGGGDLMYGELEDIGYQEANYGTTEAIEDA
jgi:3-oxoacyl-(acyl-carrier-protein) synthase